MDGGQYNLLSKYDYEVLWKIIESENLRFYLTDLAIQKAQFCCRLLGGTDWANKFIAKLKSDSKMCFVTDQILSQARLTRDYPGLDFEDIVEIMCVEASQLDGIVSDDPTFFKNATNTIKIIRPDQLLSYVTTSFKLWLSYTLENQKNFTGWNLQDENLVGLNLSGANLSKINAAGAEFINTNLSDCRLVRADLSQSWLMDAILSNSNLQKCNLQGADLSRATCLNTDFTNANVAGANFGDANLQGAKAALVDWTGVDLSDVDISGLNLTGAKLKDFTVRNVASFTELQQAYSIMSYQAPSLALDFSSLKKWWTAYPNGIKALFYQKQIIAGAFLLWPLTDDSAQFLQENVAQEKFDESDLEICSAQQLRKNQGSRYWYTGGVYLNYSLRNSSNFRVSYLTNLLRESLKIWVQDEGKYIPKEETIELFSFYPPRDNPSHRYGFQTQPGRSVDNKLLHKMSVTYSNLRLLLQMFGKLTQTA